MIWEFVNPATEKAAIPPLTRPPIPTATTDVEKETLKARLFEWKKQLNSHKQKELAMLNLCTYIQETVSRTYLTYTFEHDTAYDMLISLKERVAPTDQARKMELVNRYQRMKKTPKAQNIEAWLRDWEKAYTDCKKLSLPDVENDRSLFDFLNAIVGVAPEFAQAWRIDIQKSQSKNEALPSLYNMIEYFRNDRRLLNAQKGTPHGAFGASY
jgi:hypothetical protein